LAVFHIHRLFAVYSNFEGLGLWVRLEKIAFFVKKKWNVGILEYWNIENPYLAD